jgi:23S rRNA (pseudouridine1915-N3)-methyltransferase
MWDLVVITVGRPSDQAFRHSAERYASMVAGEWRVRLEAVPASRKGEPGARKREEGGSILRRVPKDGAAIALGEGGKMLDSCAFGGLLGGLKDSGRRAVFLVGGARGLDKSVTDAAWFNLSLSRMTLPHELAAVVLLEQIYRASALYAGKAYAK